MNSFGGNRGNMKSGNRQNSNINQEIKVEIDKNNYVEQAEKVMESIGKKYGKNGVLSTNKIRNLLALAAEILNDINQRDNSEGDKLSQEIISNINYLKLRFVYEAGREVSVKSFVNEAGILYNIDKIAGSKERYLLFHRYLEALVAYKRYMYKED